jgi:hypothetical protein
LADRQPVQIVEIDIDYCTLSYGVGACDAVLGTTGVRKCYNTYETCQVRDVYNKGSLTLRFMTPTANIPKNGNVYFPALKSVSAFSSSVNIAGSTPEYGKLGKRAKVTINLIDFPYHDRYTDKYQSERVDGTGQTDEGGYDPSERGTFFTKFKSRFPQYAGRPLRVIDAYVDGGSITVLQTRHFIVTDLKGPNDNGAVTIEAKDILTLAEKKSAVAPTPNTGELEADISAVASTLTLIPTGIGDEEYPASGYGVIGSEIVTFTRSGDTVTLTERGVRGSESKSHSSGDTFQVAIDYEDQYLSEVMDDLLSNYTDIDASYLPTTDWQQEAERWSATLRLFTTITEPTPVAELLGELSILGATIWWDDVDQEIKLSMSKPISPFDTLKTITDNDNIKAITQEDKDEDRLTQIHFYVDQDDPTGNVDDKSNYNQIRVTIDTEAESSDSYNDTRIREVFCRWLNQGETAVVRIRSLRLLQRFNSAPKRFKIKLDAKDISVSLAEVLSLSSRVVTDETGKSVNTFVEVIKKSEPVAGHEVDIEAQAYLYVGKYGYIMENTANAYGSATDLEKETGCYIVDEATLEFADGSAPYEII